MYKSLLSDYEASQRSLMLENAELKKVLQQMKKEMIHILSPRKPSTRGAAADDSQEQVFVLFFFPVVLTHTKETTLQKSSVLTSYADRNLCDYVYSTGFLMDKHLYL